MDITEFAFKLLLIFFPGIICAYLIDLFTNHKERTQFEFVINSFLLGFGSYLTYAAIINLFAPEIFSEMNVIHVITQSEKIISIKEIFQVSSVSVVIAVLIVIINTRKLHFRLFKYLKITKKFGEQDVWGFLLNSSNTEWVTVRDFENNIMYDGFVKAFSDNSKEAEILLEDVQVYENITGELLYKVEAQYLSLNKDKISIELRSKPIN